MAANTTANVLVGYNGFVYGAPLATALPTDENAAPNAAFVNQGYISDGGVTTSVAEDTTDIKAWGGDVVRTITTSHKFSIQFTMIETNSTSLETFYGDQTTPATAVQIKANNHLRQSWIVDVADGTTGHLRLVIPDGEVTQTGDVVYNTQGVISYPVTLTCYADTSGVKAYLYVHDASAS